MDTPNGVCIIVVIAFIAGSSISRIKCVNNLEDQSESFLYESSES